MYVYMHPRTYLSIHHLEPCSLLPFHPITSPRTAHHARKPQLDRRIAKRRRRHRGAGARSSGHINDDGDDDRGTEVVV